MDEDQADRIIELLEEISSKLSSIESNTANIPYSSNDLDDVCRNIKELTQAVLKN